MPKVEEGAWVPPVEEEVVKRLARALDRDERSRAQRVRLETSSLLEFLDTAALRETLADGRRLAEGRFGRR